MKKRKEIIVSFILVVGMLISFSNKLVVNANYQPELVISESSISPETLKSITSRPITRAIVCCNNMRKSTTYYQSHAAQTSNYPKCTITTRKVTYCTNCYAVFEDVVTGTSVHNHPEVF